MPALKMHK